MNEELNGVKEVTQDVFNNTWLWMPNWKWIVLGVALVSAVALYKILAWALNKVAERLRRRFAHESVSGLLLKSEIHRPIALIFTGLFLATILKLLDLPGDGAHVFAILLKMTIAFAVISVVYIAAGAVGDRFQQVAAKTDNTLDDQLAPLLTRTLKFLVVVFGILVTLQNVGVNVVSVLAGLGLGGLAVALAAQDTFANIFGSLTLIFDRPFQIGDYVKVNSVDGTVEEIGLRSTRMRAPTGSLISVPNSIMAKETIENLGVRPSRRLRHVLGVTYDTSPAKLLEFMEHMKYLINQHPAVETERTTVNFTAFGDSSLNILMQCYVKTHDWAEEQAYQQEILLKIMQLAEQSKVGFAFPTRTLHVESIPQPVNAGVVTRPPTFDGEAKQ